MGQATLNVGTLRGGLNINSVPDEAEIGIDIRTVPTADHASLVRLLAQQLGAEVELETLMDLEAVYTDPQDPWVQSVFELAAPMLGERPRPRVATYFTDAAALNRINAEVVIVHAHEQPAVIEVAADRIGYVYELPIGAVVGP